MTSESAARALRRLAANDVRYRLVLVRSSAMQAYVLNRRRQREAALRIPGLGAMSLPSVPLPPAMEKATMDVLNQSTSLMSSLAERSRGMLRNATAGMHFNSSTIGATVSSGLQATAAAMRSSYQAMSNQSKQVVERARGAQLRKGKQVGGSIGTLPATVR